MAWVNLGDHHLANGNIELAIESYKLGISSYGGPKADSGRWQSMNNLAVAYVRNGDCDNSLKAFLSIEQAQMSTIISNINYAKAATTCGRSDLAKAAWLRVTEMNPGYSQAWVSLADIYRKENDPVAAMEALKKAKGQM